MKEKIPFKCFPTLQLRHIQPFLHATWYSNIRKRRDALPTACCVAYAGFETMFAVGLNVIQSLSTVWSSKFEYYAKLPWNVSGFGLLFSRE